MHSVFHYPDSQNDLNWIRRSFRVKVTMQCTHNILLWDCRKKKAIHKTITTDDKRLQGTLKRIGVNSIPAIEEVNIFKDDQVIQFQTPKGMFWFDSLLSSRFNHSTNRAKLNLLSYAEILNFLCLQFKLLSQQIHGLSVVHHKPGVSAFFHS